MSPVHHVLAFGAHPDDIEFRCAGTLALLKQAGWQVSLATVTGGEGGSRQMGPEEIRSVRLGESAAAARLLDADFHYAGGVDMDVDFTHDLRVKVVEVIRAVKPDVVITLAPFDYHTDHEEASRLVRAGCFYAPIPNYPASGETIDAVPYLYYMDSGTDIFGKPAPVQFYVDISSVMDIKTEMLICHASQRDWILAHHGHDDYVRRMKEISAGSGEKCGCDAAEGLHQHLGEGYPHDNVIAEALDGYVKQPAAKG